MPKPRNPGFQNGNHWGVCDVCGFTYRQSGLKRRWDGAVVCKEDWEVRHPQDFLKARQEDPAAKGLVRPEPVDQFIELERCTEEGKTAIAGVAVAGCAIAGTT